MTIYEIAYRFFVTYGAVCLEALGDTRKMDLSVDVHHKFFK